MKRIGVASFTFGVAVFSFLNWNEYPVSNKQLPVNLPSVSVPPPVAPPDREVVFGEGRLRTVIHEVQLKNQRLQYSIDVSYPQILGSEDLHIRKLNQRIKELATEQYQWPLSPSRTDLRYYREKWPDAFNTVDVDYEVRSATDSFLSIYFVGYSYGIGAAHSVQSSFVMNYDLTLRKELKLSDIFHGRSNYLEYISRYCLNELSRKSEFLFMEALVPRARNFQSWNIEREGIRFNFDACTVFGCADGEQTVVIPFVDLKPLLKPRALKTFTEP
jgi:hypothetical protein